MTSAMVAFGIAVCGTSLVSYLLMTRVQTRRANRRPSRGGSLPDGSSFAGGGDGGNLLWFGGHHSASDHSGASHDCGGGR